MSSPDPQQPIGGALSTGQKPPDQQPLGATRSDAGAGATVRSGSPPSGSSDAIGATRADAGVKSPTWTGTSFGLLSAQELYEVVHPIGAGGMGTIDLARERRTGRWLALKRLKGEYLHNGRLLERFQIEVQSASSLMHQNIVLIYATAEDEKGPYIAMEYVAGPERGRPDWPEELPNPPLSLEDRVKNHGALPVGEVTELGKNLCKAVGYAHKKQVIHRDIKPANILLNEEDQPKLIDFGLARQVNRQAEGMTQVGTPLVTLDYGALEQELDARLADARSDIYSIGATLYYAATGNSPRLFRESFVPLALQPIIVKAMQKDPGERFQTAAELEQALSGLASPAGGLTDQTLEDPFAAEAPLSPEGKLRQAIQRVLADGVLTNDEKRRILELRRSLGISAEDASRIFAEVRSALPHRASATGSATLTPAAGVTKALEDLLGSAGNEPATASKATGPNTPGACAACGHVHALDEKNRLARRFCEACGESLIEECPKCFAENGVWCLYCGSCGRDLAESLRSATSVLQASQHEIERLVQCGHYAVALDELRELARTAHPRLESFAEWASQKIPEVLALKEEADRWTLLMDVVAGVVLHKRDQMIDLAWQMVSGHDYKGALQVIAGIPQHLRNEQVNEVAQRATACQTGLVQLVQQARELYSQKEWKQLKPVVENLLAIQPGNAEYRKVLDSIHKMEIKQHDAAWEAACREGTLPAYRGYVEAYPTGRHVADAGSRMAPQLRDELLDDPANVALRQEYLRFRTADLSAEDQRLLQMALAGVYALFGAAGGAAAGMIVAGACGTGWALLLGLIGGVFGGVVACLIVRGSPRYQRNGHGSDAPGYISHYARVTSGYAIASLTLGITSIPACALYGFPALMCGILAGLLSHMANKAVAAGYANVNSLGLAKGGKICGLVGSGLSVLCWASSYVVALGWTGILVGLVFGAASGSGIGALIGYWGGGHAQRAVGGPFSFRQLLMDSDMRAWRIVVCVTAGAIFVLAVILVLRGAAAASNSVSNVKPEATPRGEASPRGPNAPVGQRPREDRPMLVRPPVRPQEQANLGLGNDAITVKLTPCEWGTPSSGVSSSRRGKPGLHWWLQNELKGNAKLERTLQGLAQAVQTQASGVPVIVYEYAQKGSDLWVAGEVSSGNGKTKSGEDYATPRGFICRSADGGKSWVRQWLSDNTQPEPVYGIYFADASEGWGLTIQGILHTKDGGDSWEKVFQCTEWCGVENLFILSKTELLVTTRWGSGHQLHYSRNRGASWEKPSDPVGKDDRKLDDLRKSFREAFHYGGVYSKEVSGL